MRFRSPLSIRHRRRPGRQMSASWREPRGERWRSRRSEASRGLHVLRRVRRDALRRLRRPPAPRSRRSTPAQRREARLWPNTSEQSHRILGLSRPHWSGRARDAGSIGTAHVDPVSIANRRPRLSGLSGLLCLGSSAARLRGAGGGSGSEWTPAYGRRAQQISPRPHQHGHVLLVHLAGPSGLGAAPLARRVHGAPGVLHSVSIMRRIEKTRTNSVPHLAHP